MRNLIAMSLVLMAVGGGCREKEYRAVVDLRSALAEAVDVSMLAEPPLGTMHLISTYDRTGGNNDWGNLNELKQGDLYVLADLKGPGCVKRLWMTSIDADEWLFFFDGEKEPRVRASGRDLFGKQEPFTPPLCDLVSGGAYSYMPLPFRKSLKIAVRMAKVKPDARPYYHVNYETYGADIDVRSFPAALSDAERAGIQTARAAWRAMASLDGGAAETNTASSATVRIGPGETGALVSEQGSGVIRRLWLAPELPAGAGPLDRVAMLRTLTLRMRWDGNAEASVDVPLGDFFCNGMHRRSFNSAPLASLDGLFVSRLPMYFAKSAVIAVENGSGLPVEIRCGYDKESAASPGRYLHAAWNQTSAPGQIHRGMSARGAGHIAGAYVAQFGTDGSWNMYEGDDMIWIDGETQASFRGTGLEDYFNGAWYYYGLFNLPLHGLLEKRATGSAQYRFHVPDRIGFDKSAQFNFEFGAGNAGRGYMSSVVYWYQVEPTGCGMPLPPVSGRFPTQDPLELPGLMAGLFELERIGRYSEAMDYCLESAAKFVGTPFENILKVRAAAYLEATAGYQAASATYAAAAAGGDEAAAQAADLAWFHESTTNALLGVHAMGRHRVYLDGVQVADTDNPPALKVVRVGVLPGEHVLTAEISPTKPNASFSVYLRAHGTNVPADGAWEFARQKPNDWPFAKDSNVEWKPVEWAAEMLPSMTYWQFYPNAYIDMQSMKTLVRPWQGWLDGRDTAYLRRTFVAPAPSE